MITTFALVSKKYSDLSITYSPHTGFKWRLMSIYLQSSNTGMTVSASIQRNGSGVMIPLSTTTSAYLDSIAGAGAVRYGTVDIGSLDALKINQSGGATGDTVDAIIKVEVLPA